MGYRIPTESEFNAELLSWSSFDSPGAFASPLKLTMAGFRLHVNEAIANEGSDGYYWSSTVSSTDAHYLTFSNVDASMSIASQATGFSVRCIKD